jgi:hypothetical protein
VVLRGLSAAAVVLLVAVVAPGCEATRVAPCWPPVFEGGTRLHPRFDLRTTWLEPAFRQHEACWRQPGGDGELRVFLAGSSGVYGFPLPAGRTFWAMLNRRAASLAPPVHFFNLGYVFTYQLKDALILHRSLRYAPDFIVYAITLEDLRHVAPHPYPALVEFFDGNSLALAAFADERPTGLAEPLAIYREALAEARRRAPFDAWRQVGRFLRLSASAHARYLRDTYLLSEKEIPPDQLPPEHARKMKRQQRYDCGRTRREFAEDFRNWKEWNILAYLDQIRRETAAEVVILNWPVAHEPRGRCYNVRYTEAALADYNRWLREQTRSRGFPYLDYHDLLAPSGFFDSLHPTEQGHRAIADHLERDLLPILVERAPADR